MMPESLRSRFGCGMSLFRYRLLPSVQLNPNDTRIILGAAPSKEVFFTSRQDCAFRRFRIDPGRCGALTKPSPKIYLAKFVLLGTL